MRPDQAPKLSLIHAFVALLVGAAVALGSLLWRADVDARRTILDSAERRRGQAARRIEQEVQQELSGAGAAIDDLEHALTLGAVEPSDEKALELTLTGTLARNTHLAEVSFTRATRTGFDKDGDAQLAPEGRFQVSVARRNDGVLQTRLTQQDAKGFHARERVHQPEGALAAAALGPEHDVPDPTAHLTFST
ncbi:MAG: hypothetical protein JST92_15945, partial [Deltaproteobacteria bacterium]|nr:hypothetical protein [Deltaproteobacteria bacterium]